MHFLRHFVALCSTLASSVCLGAPTPEIARFSVDLDADKHPEIITLSVDRKGDFSPFVLKVGSESYSGTYFAAEGDFPQIAFIRINYDSGHVQLQLMDSGPAFCRYHVLGYIKGKIYPLLTHEDRCQEGPRPLGNGKISVRHWMGFWSRIENYKLDKDGTVLTQTVVTEYKVGQSAVVATDFIATPANCQMTKFSRGASVTIASYDSVMNRYLVRSEDGRCGWVDEKSMAGYFEGLLWAE